MVGDNVAGCFTGNHRLFDHVDKVLPFVPVAEQRHQLSRFPVLHIVGIEVFDRVKIRFRHYIPSFACSLRTECLSCLYSGILLHARNTWLSRLFSISVLERNVNVVIENNLFPSGSLLTLVDCEQSATSDTMKACEHILKR